MGLNVKQNHFGAIRSSEAANLSRRVTRMQGIGVRQAHGEDRDSEGEGKNHVIFPGDLEGDIGGERGIRTLDTLPYTHFPGVRLRPLGHLSD